MNQIDYSELEEQGENSIEDILNKTNGLYTHTDEDGNTIGTEEGKIISIFDIGSYKSGEDNETSDRDIVVVVRDEVYGVKQEREKMNEILKEHCDGKIEFWLKSEGMYLNPEKLLKNGHIDPTGKEDCNDLAKGFSANLNQYSAKYICGRSLDGLFKTTCKVDPIEGYEFIQIRNRAFAETFFGRTEDAIIESVIEDKVKNGLEITDLDELIELYQEIFASYQTKKTRPNFEDNLSKNEMDIRNKILLNNNLMAKVGLRVFYGLHILFGGETLDKNGRVYENIKLAGQQMIKKFRLNDTAKESLSNFLNKLYDTKLAPETLENASLEDFDTFINFFGWANRIAHAEAFRQGFFWDHKRVFALNNFKSDAIPKIINAIIQGNNVHIPSLKLYLHSIVDYLNQNDNVPESIKKSVTNILNDSELSGDLLAGEDNLLTGKVYHQLAEIRKDGTLLAISCIEDAIKKKSDIIKKMSNSHPPAPKLYQLRAETELAEAYRELARVLMTQEGSSDSIKENLEQALQLDPLSPEVWSMYGIPQVTAFFETSSDETLNNIPQIGRDRLSESWKKFLNKVIEMEQEETQKELCLFGSDQAQIDKIIELKAKVQLNDFVLEELKDIQPLEDVYAIHQTYKLNPSRRGVGSQGLEGNVRSWWEKFSRKKISSLVEVENEVIPKSERKKRTGYFYETRGYDFEEQNKYIEAAASYILSREKYKLKEQAEPVQRRLNKIMTIINNRFDSSEQYLYLPENERKSIIKFARKLDRTTSSREKSDRFLAEINNFFDEVYNEGYNENLAGETAKIIMKTFVRELTKKEQSQNIQEAKRILNCINLYSKIPELNLNIGSGYFVEYLEGKNK